MRRPKSVSLEQKTWNDLRSWMIDNKIRTYEEAFKILLKNIKKNGGLNNGNTQKQSFWCAKA